MNDEQFEATMECLRDELADKLRARDTAQREALARVEAERDTAVVQMQNIRKERDAINKELGDAGFNLCIAQQQLAEAVGLLRTIETSKIIFNAEYFELNRLLVAFLARAALATQPEDRKS